MTSLKTHEQFLLDLYERNEQYRKGEFEIVGAYVAARFKIEVRNKYGHCLNTPNGLLAGRTPTIKAAIDKTKYFINMAKELYGDKYSYHKTIYTKAKELTTITCNLHGDFKISSDSHLSDTGCPKCGRQRTTDSRRITKEDFIERAKLQHGDTYDYSIVAFKNTKDKIKIICKRHGIFLQDIHNHQKGVGCPKCANEARSKQNSSNTEEFIEKAVRVHGDKFNYDLVDYKDSQSKVDIICKKHRLFKQSPSNHMQGKGCPKCADEAIEGGWSKTAWKKGAKKSKQFEAFKVYVVKCWSEEESFFKIGRTYTTVGKRFRNIPYQYKTLFTIEGSCDYIFNLEQELKNQHKEHKYIPQIKFNGMQECFSKLIIEEIKKHVTND